MTNTALEAIASSSGKTMSNCRHARMKRGKVSVTVGLRKINIKLSVIHILLVINAKTGGKIGDRSSSVKQEKNVA